jgi:hypothetical protein
MEKHTPIPSETAATTGNAEKPVDRPEAVKAVPGKARERESSNSLITPEERHRIIAQAAFVKAQRRHFRDGNADDDWFEAEAEVEAMLARRASMRAPIRNLGDSWDRPGLAWLDD